MPITKITTQYLCKYCRVAYDNEQDAIECEALGDPITKCIEIGELLSFENEEVDETGHAVYEQLVGKVIFSHPALFIDNVTNIPQHVWSYIVQHPTATQELGVAPIQNLDDNTICLASRYNWKFKAGFSAQHRKLFEPEPETLVALDQDYTYLDV